MNATPIQLKPEAEGVLARIQERLNVVGISERAASIEAFGHGSAIRNIRLGATKDPSIFTMRKLAPILQTTPEYLAFGTIGDPSAPALKAFSVHPSLYLPVTGEVAAGQWREHDTTIDHPVYDPVPVPVDPRWPKDAQFALITRGTSINRQARDGDYLACVDARATRYQPRDDELVIVERRRDGGGLIERTAKKYKRAGEVFELWPDSDDPRWQEPIIIDPREPVEGVEVAVIAFVAWIHRCVVTATPRQT